MRTIGLCLLGGCYVGPSSERIIERWASEQSVVFEDCGSIDAEGCFDEAGTAADVAAMTCFAEAFDTCVPARLDEVRSTDEGDPLRYTSFVVPDEVGGCVIVAFSDATEDRYGPREIVQRTCEALDVEAERCASVDPSDCVEDERW